MVDKRFGGTNEEIWIEWKKQIKGKSNTRKKEWVEKQGDVNKKFEQIKNLWLEAEMVVTAIEYEKKEVERKINKGGNKKRIISLESDLRRKEEEIETLWDFREELEELMAAACEPGSL